MATEWGITGIKKYTDNTEMPSNTILTIWNTHAQAHILIPAVKSHLFSWLTHPRCHSCLIFFTCWGGRILSSCQRRPSSSHEKTWSLMTAIWSVGHTNCESGNEHVPFSYCLQLTALLAKKSFHPKIHTSDVIILISICLSRLYLVQMSLYFVIICYILGAWGFLTIVSDR